MRVEGTNARAGEGSGNRAPLPFGGAALSDPLCLQDALRGLGIGLVTSPRYLFDAQQEYAASWGALVNSMTCRMFGLEAEPVAVPEADDRRFTDAMWEQSPWFDFLKQSYLVNARAWTSFVEGAPGLDERSRRRLDFFLGQMIDALAPTNFFATNPKALGAAFASGGASVLAGMGNALRDFDPTTGRLKNPMSSPDAFEVGKSVAATPGKVVFRNRLIELIQYAPATAKVRRRPILLVPPWMNKFYVMDLRPENSMVKWLVERGHSVFVVSWFNPDSSLADLDFEDYLLEGPLAALRAIESATGEREVNAVGYCLGGIALGALAAWLHADEDDERNRLASITLFATMVDFSDTGDISVFIDEKTLPPLADAISQEGFLSGQRVADAWRAVRANELFWSFHIDNYLLGKEPSKLDLLFWNSDPTNMPAAAHLFLMRNMYLENRLCKPDGLTLAGRSIDMSKVKTPAYLLAAEDDHIAPWRTAYLTTGIFSGKTEFVLGGSGHIAGVINHPKKEKYGYRTAKKIAAGADEWLASSKEHKGSWWPHWDRWLEAFGGGEIEARIPGEGGLPALEDAPGTYVMRPMPRT
ncbi:PHA/PHB synthase family protein [Thioalkalivibrio sp. HK1]|uniref:PHA/PHB synthase family protein n=1 Tax=Thioalkalivibrio sp. HK1 TaxID=1469245 RepID=UPI0018CC71A3|nr:class I poly(R)-hydroxyalkanoic acid synthase [Thioalkalivibrio sp. HK1]